MSLLTVSIRIFLAILLSGLIGMEREIKSRPAGLRTHILVCVGAALVMLTSEYTFLRYHSLTNMDPTRLGAQVISGIGFLGAGTIIRQGSDIKGLTTAASLWAMACVGLAIGTGFYSGAIVGAVVIYLTLIGLRKFEKFLENKSTCLNICIEKANSSEKIGEIGAILSKYGANIRHIEFVNNGDCEEKDVIVNFILKTHGGIDQEKIILEISNLVGVKVS